jgi:hypothetical protein
MPITPERPLPDLPPDLPIIRRDPSQPEPSFETIGNYSDAEPVEVEAVHVGLTAEQEIRRHALHEATTIGATAGLFDDDKTPEENAAVALTVARPLVAWIADGDPAVGETEYRRGLIEAGEAAREALTAHDPDDHGRLISVAEAIEDVRTAIDRLAPAHSTAFEGSQSALEPRTGPGEGNGQSEAPEGESGAAQNHAALAYSVCVPCALRQPGCGKEPELIHTGEVTA